MATEILQCQDCNKQFEFTSGEQTFYTEKNLTPPKRCKPCRAIKKQNRAAKEAAASGFDREDEPQRDSRNKRRDGRPGRW